MDNPWQVDSIEEFSYLKCPECNYDTKEKSIFKYHAIENHPLSRVLFETTELDNSAIEETDMYNPSDIEKYIDENYTELEFPPSNSQTSFEEENGSDDSNFDYQDDNMNKSFLNEDPLVIGFSYETIQEGKNLRKNPKSNGKKKRKKPFECTDCGTKFQSKCHLENHISAVYEGEKPFSCPICNKGFTRKNYVKHHIEKFHANGEVKKPYRCPICNFGLSRKSYVKDHIARIHKKTWSCEFCDETFKFQAKLKAHTTNVHKGQKPFLCKICNASFATNGEQKKHTEAIHEGKMPFTCDICDAGFWNRPPLQGIS